MKKKVEAFNATNSVDCALRSTYLDITETHGNHGQEAI